MRSKADAILQAPVTRYLDELLSSDPLLERMEQFARDQGHPIADRDVARLLETLVKSHRPLRVVEVGTNIGYSVVAMGRQLPDHARIESIEIDPETLGIAGDFIGEAGLRCEVVLLEGAALDVLPELEEGIDLAFIDCVKIEYQSYLDILIPKMRSGGLIVLDNVLWRGEVAEKKRSEEAEALDRVNRFLVSDPRLMAVVIPMSDGIGLAAVL